MNKTTPFQRYPQDSAAYPTRPWWQGVDQDAVVRRDGLFVQRSLRFDEGAGGQEGQEMPIGEQIVISAPDGKPLATNVFPVEGATREQFEAAMAQADREWPLAPPPPTCGQIWYWPDVKAFASVLGHVDKESGYAVHWSFGGGGSGGPYTNYAKEAWPPGGLSLVAGPGAPWAGDAS